MPRKSYYKYGYESGRDASYETDWEPGEMEEAYENDETGEIAGEVLENWQQSAGSIYYQDLTDRQLNQFEEGFYAGFEAGVKEQMAEVTEEEGEDA